MSEERRGQRARQKTAAGAVSKAMKGLVGGVAPGTAEERSQWTSDLIPRSTVVAGPCTSPEECAAAAECAWGAGDVRVARTEMRNAGQQLGGNPSIPWVRLAPLSAPGPSGDRQEHLDDVLNCAGVSCRRKLTRCLDELTVRWASNKLPATCRWLLNTQVLFLMKEREPSNKEFDDFEWLDASLEGTGDEWLQSVPESAVVEQGPELAPAGPAALEPHA